MSETRTENPSPRDEDDRNMLVRGAKEMVYLSSARTEEAVERNFRNRAQSKIPGGTGSSLVGPAIILVKGRTAVSKEKGATWPALKF